MPDAYQTGSEFDKKCTWGDTNEQKWNFENFQLNECGWNLLSEREIYSGELDSDGEKG